MGESNRRFVRGRTIANYVKQLVSCKLWDHPFQQFLSDLKGDYNKMDDETFATDNDDVEYGVIRMCSMVIVAITIGVI